MPHFLDTNILLYSISRNPADALKRERAIALLGRDDGALSIQVLQEFYVQATRATRARPLPHETAVGLDVVSVHAVVKHAHAKEQRA